MPYPKAHLIKADCQQCLFGQFIYHTPNFYQTWSHLQNAINILSTLDNKEFNETIDNLKQLDIAIDVIVNQLIHKKIDIC